MKTYYTIYQTTNLINNKIYIGMHVTQSLTDNYLGSGVKLKKAIKKYGKENFKKEILFIFNNFADMQQKEIEIINEEFVKSRHTYNVQLGGKGSWHYVNTTGLNGTRKGVERRMQLLLDPDWIKKWKELQAIGVSRNANIFEQIAKRKETLLKRYGTLKTNNGSPHTEISKKKISNAKKGKCKGKKNPAYGTVLIHNIDLKKTKRVNREMLDTWINAGWQLGAVYNWELFEGNQRKKQEKKSKREELLKIQKDEAVSQARNLYKQYCESDLSLNQFAKTQGKTRFVLMNYFKRHLDIFDEIKGKKGTPIKKLWRN